MRYIKKEKKENEFDDKLNSRVGKVFKITISNGLETKEKLLVSNYN